jgi:hypothetical protein
MVDLKDIIQMANKLMLVFLGVCLFFPGCKENGPMQKAGERTKEIINNVKEGKPALQRTGPIEKARKSLDDDAHVDEKK